VRSDVEAKAFAETANLSQLDLSGFTPMRFAIEPQTGLAEHAPYRPAPGRDEGKGHKASSIHALRGCCWERTWSLLDPTLAIDCGLG
jgi:hypothetical protein